MIRVGSIVDGKKPAYEGYQKIICMTKSSPYGELGPYCLKTDEGYLFENYWQFSKCYETVPASTQRYSQWDPTIIWNYPEEKHMKDDKLLPEYWQWRRKGMECQYPVRYPIGRTKTHLCRGTIIGTPDTYENINYVEARKKVYLQEYCRLVKNQAKFKKLEGFLQKGKNLLIIEVDGPRQRSMKYYKSKYDVPDDWIENETLLVNEKNMNILINDTRERFGHGFCLAISLLNLESKIR